MARKDLTGQKFGKLTVTSYAFSEKNRSKWNCICDCGKERQILGASLSQGKTVSCGCIKGDSRRSDLTGKVFGLWTVICLDHIEKVENKKNKETESFWSCECACGTKRIVKGSLITRIKSCGCATPKLPPMDVTGKRYGRLVALKVIPAKLSIDNKTRWLCECDCGEMTTPTIKDLQKGDTKSCGCLLKEMYLTMNLTHGHTAVHLQGSNKSSTYMTWVGMLSRCLNPKCRAYHNYGGRGITVCDRWLKFENFLEDMGERPEGLTIERVNNMEGYYKENCIYTTMRENTWNKRDNFLVNYRGDVRCLSEWVYKLTEEGKPPLISTAGIHWRLKHGWNFEEAFYTPPRN